MKNNKKKKIFSRSRGLILILHTNIDKRAQSDMIHINFYSLLLSTKDNNNFVEAQQSRVCSPAHDWNVIEGC